ncbi:unnamed protein product [Nesidiocoris tenuis]|uniref:Uncharacterized protein n=1 Tax=Nesidiocoris tenuis TaxID=355587 RepID=A0A6H5FVY5_9HEMI|nr:unnamed protein product [Nesidiocoris tenuis]
MFLRRLHVLQADRRRLRRSTILRRSHRPLAATGLPAGEASPSLAAELFLGACQVLYCRQDACLLIMQDSPARPIPKEGHDGESAWHKALSSYGNRLFASAHPTFQLS